MALDAAIKNEIIKAYATHEGDTGSPEVQIAVMSRRISDLTEHLKMHKHDHHTRRGLMALVGRRLRMLGFALGVLAMTVGLSTCKQSITIQPRGLEVRRISMSLAKC